MKRLKNYLFLHITTSFFSIFFTLFTITSIVYLVKIAAYTSVIKITALELLTFYAYIIPDILFYTIPISIFAASLLALSKLSKEYELVVLSSFGLNPMVLLKILFVPFFVATLLTLIIAFGLIPKTSYLSTSLLQIKKNEANFNISASEFGQKFGKWLIFIEKDSNKTFQNVKMLNTDEKSSTFITSDSAKIVNQNGNLNLNLFTGVGYIINQDQIRQIEFSTLSLGDSLNDLSIETFTTPAAYWSNIEPKSKKMKTLTFNIFVALFPLVSIVFIISFSFFNPRYESNRATIYTILLILAYYVLTFIIASKFYLQGVAPFVVFWLLCSYFVYSKTIKNRF